MGDRLPGDGWPAGGSEVPPEEGALGGMGASFLEALRGARGLCSAGDGGVAMGCCPPPFCAVEMGDSSLGFSVLARSAVGGKPKLVAGDEGLADTSGTCSGMGECGVAGGSAGGAGGCVAGGVAGVLRAPEVPLRATHEVSITLTPMPSFL